MAKTGSRSPQRTRERLEKEFAKVRARDRNVQEVAQYDPSYPDRYYRALEKEKRLKETGDPMRRQREAGVPSNMVRGYIKENGIDPRSDQPLYTRDRQEFNRRVGHTVMQNGAERVRRARKKK